MTHTIPNDFEKYAKLESDRQLEARYDLNLKVIRRMRRTVGIPSPVTRSPLTLPDDFSKVVHLPNTQLATLYSVGEKVIRRLRKEYAAAQGNEDLTRSTATPMIGFTSGMAKSAANYLIREAGCRPVYNMLIRGKEFEGQFYVNNRVMTTDAMIQMAIEKGFDPRASMG